MRYYSTQRPIVPGSVPGAGLTEVYNFNSKTFVPEIDREAYGWAEYDHALTAAQVEQYELVPAGMRIWWSVIHTHYNNGKVTAHLGPVTEALEQPEKRFSASEDKMVLITWLNSREAAERLADDLRANA